jgi:hypothetical protein
VLGGVGAVELLLDDEVSQGIREEMDITAG